MISRVTKAMIGTLAIGSVFAQPALRLKNRVAETPGASAGRGENLSGLPVSRRMSPGRSHWLVQFAHQPTIDDIRALQLRGARISGYIPEHAFIISASDQIDLKELGLARVEQLRVSDKLSRELVPTQRLRPAPHLEEGAGLLIAEFHSGVDPAAARQILARSGLEPFNHPQLLDGHYLVAASPAEAARLAEWDEVAYLFPAAPELSTNEPLHVCAGAVTELGTTGQLIAKVGAGWAANGEPARLGYAWGALSSRLDNTLVQREAQRALAEWSKYVAVDFSRTEDAHSRRALTFWFGRGPLGGPIPFDGPGGMLAYTFYPSPPNPEPIAGDLYIDDDENWQFGTDPDIFSVALHEIGHALGLAHSDRPGAVMYPYYRRAVALSEEDVTAIRELYEPRVWISADPLPGLVPGALAPSDSLPFPSSPVPQSPDPPFIPAPKPEPDPPITEPPPASPKPLPGSPTPDITAPSLAILTPATMTLATSQETILFTGSALDDRALEKVVWTTSGKNGTADGKASWRALVPLVPGINVVTIRAFDAAGNSSWRAVTVTRR